MKKSLYVFWGILVVIGVITVLMTVEPMKKQSFTIKSCVSEETGIRAAKAAGLGTSGERLNTEDMIMQIVYQLARRCVVKITVKDSAGSGIIWKINDGIVIISNRHLLMKDVRAEVTFGGRETVSADIIGYSQQYDIGFAKVPEDKVVNSILRDIYEAVPVFYETDSEESRENFRQSYSGKRILQVGAVTESSSGKSSNVSEKTANFSTGSIKELYFVPLFNTFVLETACYSRAGMSGGGVFDEAGRFLGMISGGDVPEDSEIREAEITYSIPPVLIEAEYKRMANDN